MELTDYLVPCIEGVTLYFIKVRAESRSSAADVVKRMDGHYGCGIQVADGLEPSDVVDILASHEGEPPQYIHDPKRGSVGSTISVNHYNE